MEHASLEGFSAPGYKAAVPKLSQETAPKLFSFVLSSCGTSCKSELARIQVNGSGLLFPHRLGSFLIPWSTAVLFPRHLKLHLPSSLFSLSCP